MNKKDKLIKRFNSLPKDFTFDELTALFSLCGFELNHKGATSGSRVEFINEALSLSYIMHKPHPANVVKGYMMKQARDFLVRNGLIKQDSKI